MIEPEPISAEHELLSAVRGLGPLREPDPTAHQRAAEIDPADWEGMMGPDDDPDQ